jgi:hypothetical protein
VAGIHRKAIEWQALLESDKIANQAETARREGITRARAGVPRIHIHGLCHILWSQMAMAEAKGRPPEGEDQHNNLTPTGFSEPEISQSGR